MKFSLLAIPFAVTVNATLEHVTSTRIPILSVDYPPQLYVHPASSHSAVMSPAPTAPPRIDLAKRALSNTCAYFPGIYTISCTGLGQYCAYQYSTGGAIGCYSYNSATSAVANIWYTGCLDNNQYSSCASSSCNLNSVVWCTNSGFTKCVTLDATDTVSHTWSFFLCASVQTNLYGGLTAAPVTTTAVLTSIATSVVVSTATATSVSISTATSVSSYFQTNTATVVNTATATATLVNTATYTTSFGTTYTSMYSSRSTTNSASSGTSTQSPDLTATPSNKPSTGTIVGAVVGGVLGLAVLVAAGLYIRHRVNKKRAEREYGDVPTMTGDVTDMSSRY